MNYDPHIETESKVVPGARFTVKKISVKRRAAFLLSIAEWTAKDREIRKELDALREDFRAALKAAGVDPDSEGANIPEGLQFPDAKVDRIAELDAEQRRIRNDLLTPAYLRVGFKSIEGFSISQKVPDAEALIEDGPPELCAEISAAVDRAMGMSLEERLNLASPSTSGAVVDGKTPSTTAPDAAS